LAKFEGASQWYILAIGLIFLLGDVYFFKKSLDYLNLSVAVVVWSDLSIILTIIFDYFFFKTRLDYKVAFFRGMGLIAIFGMNYYSGK
jgi:multidrug transporter EmrE-like cation transporter